MRNTLDEKKIAFIICFTDLQQLDECKYYITKLDVPEGYTIDLLGVPEVKSMTSGYNEAMNSSDAKYKIYIHQDVFLIHKYMIREMLHIFSNPTIGMIGTLGMSQILPDADFHTYWNRGITLNGMHYGINEFNFVDSEAGDAVDVAAIDGMFMATQYDIEWDERLEAWHMYDISQSVRFTKEGYRVVVLNRYKSWTLHDSGYCSYLHYDEQRKKLCELYPEIFTYEEIERKPEAENIDETLIKEIMVDIAQKEINAYGKSTYGESYPIDDFLRIYSHIKYLVHRIEFGMPREDWDKLLTYVKNKMISVVFLTEVLVRCSLFPEHIIEIIEENLTEADSTVLRFDQYQRYHNVAKIIRNIKKQKEMKQVHILEVGANIHCNLGKELPVDVVTYTDLVLPEELRYDNRCFKADATNLEEIADGTYDIAVALDVFEHVPKTLRKAFLLELYRVSKYAVVMCFPHDAEYVCDAEMKINELHKKAFGDEQPWLKEHIENGLPSLSMVDEVLSENGISYQVFSHGEIGLFEKISTINILLDDSEMNQEISNLNICYNRELMESDIGEHNYRAFIIMQKDIDPLLLPIADGANSCDFKNVYSVIEEMYQKVLNRIGK